MPSVSTAAVCGQETTPVLPRRPRPARPGVRHAGTAWPGLPRTPDGRTRAPRCGPPLPVTVHARRGRTCWLPFRPGASGRLAWNSPSPARGGFGDVEPGAGRLVLDEIDGLLGGGVDGGLFSSAGNQEAAGRAATAMHVRFGMATGCFLACGALGKPSQAEPAGEALLWEGGGHPGPVGLWYLEGLADGQPAGWQVEESGAAGVAGPLQSALGFALLGEGQG